MQCGVSKWVKEDYEAVRRKSGLAIPFQGGEYINFNRYQSISTGLSTCCHTENPPVHDHIIRGYSSYRRICDYINENPAKWEDDIFYSKNYNIELPAQ